MRLTQADVERLAKATSPRMREEVAGKVASSFAEGRLVGREKDVAVAIFRLLAQDAEIRVRAMLSQQLQSCSELPRDVALTLAQDVEKVAIPVLEFSQVLEEGDLLSIIASARESAKLSAIARRELVPFPVSDALLRRDDEAASRTLLANKGAEIDENALLHVVNTMAQRESVIEALMARGSLPVACIEKIFMSVSEAMKQRLITQHRVSRHLAEGQLEYAREMNTLGVSGHADDINVEALVRHMHKQRKLTSSLVMRALCVGDLRFFEHALAELTDIPAENVRKLMLDAGEQGFKSLYRLSPLPPMYYHAVKQLLEVVLQTTRNGREHPVDFGQRVIDTIESAGYDKTVEYMPLLLAIVKGNASEFTRIH